MVMEHVKSISSKGPGRRPAGQNTKASIIDAAQTLFAASGYDRTSLRRIAQLADVDPALIAHYFGSKQQLFVESMLPLYDGPKLLPDVLMGDPHCIGERLARLFVMMTTDPQRLKLVTGMMRSISSEEQAAQIGREFMQQSIMRIVEGYVPGPNKQLQANLLASQLMGVFMARYIMKVEPLATATKEELIVYLAPRLQAHFEPL